MSIYIPPPVQTALDNSWEDFEPQFEALLATELTAENIKTWLIEWSQLGRLLGEIRARLSGQPP